MHDTVGKSLEIVAGGGLAVRRQIAESFMKNVLGIQGKLNQVTPRRFEIDRLRHPMAFDTDPADGIRTVKVTLPRLALNGARHERIAIEVDPADRVDIYAKSAQWFGDTDPLRRPEWRVTHAALRIVFHPEIGKTREKVVSIQLHAPNGSNLRGQTERHQIVSRKYLARWGLLASKGV